MIYQIDLSLKKNTQSQRITLRQACKKGGTYGVFMFVITCLLLPYFTGKEITSQLICIGALLWFGAGVLMSLCIKIYSRLLSIG